MKTAEGQLLIFERRISPEKRCRPPSGWGIMHSQCFSAPLPRGLVEGASAAQHIAAGAAWVVFPEANPTSFSRYKGATASREGSGINPSGDGEAKIDKWLQSCSLRRSKPKATKPLASRRGTGANCVGLALCLPGRCFASATASHNSLYAISSADP